LAQRGYARQVFCFRQRCFYGLRQRVNLWCRQVFAVHHPLAEFQIVTFKNREGRFFGVVGDKKPIAGDARMINRRVAPRVGGLGAGRAAGFHIGAVRIQQAEFFWVALAGAQHAVERGQILRLFNHFFSAAANSFRGKAGEAFQPQLFDLVEHLGVAVSLVILVVIINAKQCEDFIERVYVVAADLPLIISGVLVSASWPSCGR
jgi:hypothetical protein